MLFFFSCNEEKKQEIIKSKKNYENQKIDSSDGNSNIKNNSLLSFDDLFKKNGLNNFYQVSNKISPNFLKADFDGNKIEDVVFLIEEKNSGKIGLIFFHSENSYFIVGAGKNFNDRWDDMNWLDILELDSNGLQHETLFDKDTSDVIGDKTVIIPNVGISIREEEGSGGLLYFSEGKYKYLHQGD